MKKPKVATRLAALNWDFYALDEGELEACCFWEYARESVCLIAAVRTAKAALARQGKGQPVTLVTDAGRVSHVPETIERQALREAERAFGLLHLTGWPLTFWTGLPFPETPWQGIDETKRRPWKNRCPDKFADAVKFPAFQVTGDLNIAHALDSAAQDAHNAQAEIYQRLSEIDRDASAGISINWDEAARLREKLSVSPTMIQGVGGVDSFIAQINWRMFSKAEIKACFNKWVDGYACPLAKPGERGKKDTAWRARIERLGLLRLRREHTFEEVKPFLKRLYPLIKSAQSQPPRKFDDKGECNREAVKSGEDFLFLFPFLAETLPCSLMD